MAVLRKDGKAYDSAEVVVTILGSVESEVKSIEYSSKQDHQVNHSLGPDATSWSMGKKNHECKMDLYLNATRKLENLCNGDLLTLAPFDVICTYVNEFNQIINDKITMKFQSNGRTVNGEMGLAYSYDMFVLGIQYNI